MNVYNRAHLIDIIARAIKRSDKKLFFENYTRQAQDVLKALAEEDIILIPKALTEEILEKAKEAIPQGRTKGQHLVSTLYQAVIKAWEGKGEEAKSDLDKHYEDV
jgi:predicted lipid-binding transport protein (Tim44 family)